MRAKFVDESCFGHVLAMLTPANRLIAEVLLLTGLRISDVLKFRKEDVGLVMHIVETKTKKKRTVFLTPELVKKLKGDGKRGFCFPHRLDKKRHRTRQAVWKDFRRAAKILRLGKGVSTHSCRKNFAVAYCKEHGLEATQEVLNHDNIYTTMIYAMADQIKTGKHRKKR